MTRSDQTALALLVAFAAITCVPFLSGGWYTDDFIHLTRLTSNPGVVDIFTRPDAFGFYRPLAQLTLLLDLRAFGDWPAAFRATNLVLHLLVIVTSFVAARVLTEDDRAAVFSTLAFVLTPKAHGLAVLWASARPELVMSLFALGALASWAAWTHGRNGQLAIASGAYLLSLLSKETGLLLPLAFLALPGGVRTLRQRLSASVLMAAIAAAVVAVRGHAGALMPWSPDNHYGWTVPPGRWLHQANNYFDRAILAPAGIALVIGGIAWIGSGRRRPMVREPVRTALWGAVWFTIIIAPVIGIAARSELYLYLGGFGFCVAAGTTVSAIAEATVAAPRRLLAGMLICLLAFGSVQVTRNYGTHRDLVFSAGLVDALRHDSEIVALHGGVSLLPANAATAATVRDSIDGYFDVVVRYAVGRNDIWGTVATPGTVTRTAVARLVRSTVDGGVQLEPFTPPRPGAPPASNPAPPAKEHQHPE